MNRSAFKIQKMDCPAEEQLVRLKLGNISGIEQLQFDLQERQLTVFHKTDENIIEEALHTLKLDTSLLSTEKNVQPLNNSEVNQRKALWWVLAINALLFAVEMSTGLIANSMGLIADSLDMLADAIVYGLSLIAIGGSLYLKNRVTKLSGIFQITLALVGLLEVVRKFLNEEAIPLSNIMVVISLLALIGNVACLFILRKIQTGEAHLKASWIFTSNDVVINIGVITAGAMVAYFHSALPDLLIGTIIFFIVITGAYRILQLAKS